MTPKTHRRKSKTPIKIRKSQEKEVNLISLSHKESATEQVINKKNVNQLWKWDTLEDVKF